MRDKELKLEEVEPSRKLRVARCHGIQGEGSGKEERRRDVWEREGLAYRDGGAVEVKDDSC